MSAILKQVEQDNSEQELCGLEVPRWTCSLGGAMLAMVSVRNAVPILHSGGGCGFIQCNGFGNASGGSIPSFAGGHSTPCTSLLEKDVIFGGEKKLKNQIISTIELMDGDFFGVISGCIPALIGDDVDQVVNDIRNAENLSPMIDKIPPIINIRTSGFHGSSYDGYELFLDSVIDQLLVPLPKEKGLVNVIGVAPYQHIFWRGDLFNIKAILEKVGLKPITMFEQPEGVEMIKKMSAAELTIVVSPWLGIKAASKLKEKFGIPYVVIPGIPVGPKETTRFLRTIGDNIPTQNLDKVITHEKWEAYSIMEHIAMFYQRLQKDMYFAVVSDANYAIGITRYMTNDAGGVPSVVVITDNPPIENRDAIIEALTKDSESTLAPEIYFEIDSYKIDKILEKYIFSIIFASSIEKYPSQERYKAMHISISFPAYDRVILERSYAGYHGGASLLEDLASKAASPML